MAKEASAGDNIRGRRFLGIVSLISAAALAFVAIGYRTPWWPRAIVFVPLWAAGIALLPERKRGRAVPMAAALTVVLMLLG